MARAAAARCETRFFSRAEYSPTVRPPGGSHAGSKIGSYPNPPLPRGSVAMRPSKVPRRITTAGASDPPAVPDPPDGRPGSTSASTHR